MNPDVIEQVGLVGRERFDALDDQAGAAGCYERISQREADGRWRAKYVYLADDGAVKAVVPLYSCRGKAWPDPAYDPSTWDLPDEVAGEFSGGRAILLQGCADLRSGLHIAEPYRDAYHVRAILVAAARVAAWRGCGIAFPYVFPEAQRALAEAASGRITWSLLGREALLSGISDLAWEERQKSRVRYVLRRDRRLMAEAGVTATALAWSAVQESACELIAAHNARKGLSDHPEFVRMRHHEWDECPGVELVAFTATAGRVAGVLTALVWTTELELYEIGLSGDEGAERLAAYLALLFHEPIKFARSRGLRNIRAGMAATIPKTARGATLRNLYGGVLGAVATKEVAGHGF